MLYESYIHPITILSTLPSAGVGALLALMLFHVEFDIIGLIGVILLIGIVKKNAIMMIDFAIEAKRARNLSSYDAIFEACLLRFRPIMMTTSAAILGAVPLALSFGNGGEIRRPLGIAIVGGLIISQLLTLYTTPVLYLYLDRLSGWSLRTRRRHGSATTERAAARRIGVLLKRLEQELDRQSADMNGPAGCSSTGSPIANAPDERGAQLVDIGAQLPMIGAL